MGYRGFVRIEAREELKIELGKQVFGRKVGRGFGHPLERTQRKTGSFLGITKPNKTPKNGEKRHTKDRNETHKRDIQTKDR